MRTGLLLVTVIFAVGTAAALAADAMQPQPSPTPTPAIRPLPPVGTPVPAPTAPAGRQLVPAPIDKLEVVIRESAPPQYSLRIQAGLPSGCAQKGTHRWSRTGDAITVEVLNSMPTGDPICTMIYGMYDLAIELGTDFKRGVTYSVRVNDKTTTFVGQ
jgi:opacity protein-like surface antigen